MGQIEAQPMNWKFTCKELPPEYERVIIWYNPKGYGTPTEWKEAYYSSKTETYKYCDMGQQYEILASQVSHWFIPTPPVSYCGGQEGDGGPLE
jgi:hypothetical protein